MTQLSLPAEAVEALVHKLILDAIGPEERDAILSEALAWMSKPQTDGYYGKKNLSPLQEAFQIAMRAATLKLVNEMIESDAEVRTFVQTSLRALIRDFSRQLDPATDHELKSVLIEAMVNYLANQRTEGRY